MAITPGRKKSVQKSWGLSTQIHPGVHETVLSSYATAFDTLPIAVGARRGFRLEVILAFPWLHLGLTWISSRPDVTLQCSLAADMIVWSCLVGNVDASCERPVERPPMLFGAE